MQLLDSKVFPDQPASLRAVVSKTAADQLLWAPIMTCVFFAVLKTLEGHPELIEATIQVSACSRSNSQSTPVHYHKAVLVCRPTKVGTEVSGGDALA